LSGRWFCAVGDVEAREERDADPGEDSLCAEGAGAGLAEHSEQQEGDEGSVDLDFDGVFGAPDEAFDLEVLLDPLEQEFDLPALLVEGGDLVGGTGEIVGNEAQGLLVGAFDDDFTQWHVEQEVPGTAARRGMADLEIVILQDALALWRSGDDIAPVAVGFQARDEQRLLVM
jgi:hypothetical protein